MTIVDEWVQVGECPVDAGHIILVDSCYLLETRGRDGWSGGVYDREIVGRCDESAAYPLRLDVGDIGDGSTWDAGVVVQSGYGDGCYPVEVRYTDEGRVAEVRVRFIEEEEDCDMCDL